MTSGPADVPTLVRANRFLAGAPLAVSASPDRPELRNASVWRSWVAPLALAAALGFTSGTRVALGTGGLADVARGKAAPVSTGVRSHEPLVGSVWIPRGSTAGRHALDPHPVMWVPSTSTASADERLRPRLRRPNRVRFAALEP